MMKTSHLNAWILAISLLLFGPCSAAEHGRIEGLLDEGSIPVENQIHLSRILWLDYGSDVDRHGYTAKADEKGRFAFENVAPGWYELGHMIQTSGGRDPSFTDTIRRPVQVEANQTRKILLGAEGRIVEGRFVLPEDYTDTLPFNSLGDITALYTPRPSLPIDYPNNYDQMSRKQQHEWRQRWHESNRDASRRLLELHAKDNRRRHYAFMVEDSGRFRIDHVIPGEYELYVTFSRHPWERRYPWELASHKSRIKVPDFSPAEKDETFDLGKLLLTVKPGLEIGQEAPDFAVRSLQNQSFALANLRGKYLLLYFWSSWTLGGHAEIEQAYEEYRDDSELVILGMNVNDTLDEVREHLRNEAVGWPVVHLGNREDSTLAQDYHAVIPSYIVIGPGGKIRAADYFGGDRLETALASFLGK